MYLREIETENDRQRIKTFYGKLRRTIINESLDFR